MEAFHKFAESKGLYCTDPEYVLVSEGVAFISYTKIGDRFYHNNVYAKIKEEIKSLEKKE